MKDKALDKIKLWIQQEDDTLLYNPDMQEYPNASADYTRFCTQLAQHRWHYAKQHGINIPTDDIPMLSEGHIYLEKMASHDKR